MSTIRLGLKDANQMAHIQLGKLKDVTQKQKVSLSRERVVSKGVNVAETQTKLVVEASSSCQTDVSTLSSIGEVTAADLFSDEPSVAYWKSLADNTENTIESEFDRSLNLSVRLDESILEAEEAEYRLNDLVEVLNESSKDGFSVANEEEEEKEDPLPTNSKNE